MNARRCSENDYIEFLLAAQTAFGCVEAAHSQPDRLKSAAHDAYTRLLTRRPLDPEALWNEAQLVLGGTVPAQGLLVLDDTTLDKPYAQKIDLVSRHWSGKHHRVVYGINLLSLVWTQSDDSHDSHDGHDGQPSRLPVLPLDFRVYDVNADARGQHFTKNDHFRAMVTQAKARGLQPDYVAFDSWYAGLDNLKHLRREGFHFLARLKSNRQVNPDRSGLVEVSTLSVPPEGRVVQLRGFGLVRLFCKRDSQGEAQHWATNDIEMSKETFEATSAACWRIETYHRGLKQCCGIEKAQVRSATGQKNHLLLALRAFLRLEGYRLQTGVSWYAAKRAVVRDAIRQARTQPTCRLAPTA
jgi:putative transposase